MDEGTALKTRIGSEAILKRSFLLRAPLKPAVRIGEADIISPSSCALEDLEQHLVPSFLEIDSHFILVGIGAAVGGVGMDELVVDPDTYAVIAPEEHMRLRVVGRIDIAERVDDGLFVRLDEFG